MMSQKLSADQSRNLGQLKLTSHLHAHLLGWLLVTCLVPSRVRSAFFSIHTQTYFNIFQAKKESKAEAKAGGSSKSGGAAKAKKSPKKSVPSIKSAKSAEFIEDSDSDSSDDGAKKKSSDKSDAEVDSASDKSD